jgi:hypothetical protein
MKYANLVILCTILLLSGCVNDSELIDGIWLPKDPSWSLPLSDYSNHDYVDFDALYVFRKTYRSGFCFIRLWPSGQIMYHCVKEYPDASDGDSFARGDVGRYSLNENEITIEMYVGDPGSWKPVYARSYGVLNKDRIVLYKTIVNSHTEIHEPPLVYEKMPVMGMECLPYW